MKDESTPSDAVVIECDLPHTPEKVWHALTDQDLLPRWLVPTDLRPEVGSRFRLPATDAGGADLVDCEVIEAVANRTLRWRQVERIVASENEAIESIVGFELQPTDDGTHLRIVHDQFQRVLIDTSANVTCLLEFKAQKSRAKVASACVPTIVCMLKAA